MKPDPTKPSVAIVAWNFPVRSESFVLQHALGLARAGWEVTVISQGPGPGYSAQELDEIDRAGVRRQYTGSMSLSFTSKLAQLVTGCLRWPALLRHFSQRTGWTPMELLNGRRIVAALAKLNADNIHFHFGALAAPASVIGLPDDTVVTWHGYDSDVIPSLRGSGIYRTLFASGCLHTANSRFLSGRLEALGCRPETLSIIPMGIDLDDFEFSPPPPADESLSIVSIGRLTEVKGHAYLIQSVRRLLDEGVKLTLRIIGTGPCHAGLQKQINETGHCNSILLVGQQPKEIVKRELQQAHLFALTGVLTSEGQAETQGVVYAEAQAIGRPVIGSRLGGVPDSMENYQTGILCPPEDVDAITEAILYFHSHPDRIRTFGTAARRFVEERFSFAAMLKAFVKLYDHPRTKNSQT